MIRKTRLRRTLLTSALLAGLALALPAGARVAAPDRTGVTASRGSEGGDLLPRFTHVWRWLAHLWGKEGSSMDPLGRH